MVTNSNDGFNTRDFHYYNSICNDYNSICNLSVKPIIRLQIELKSDFKYNCNDYKSNCNTRAKRLQIAMMGLTLRLQLLQIEV